MILAVGPLMAAPATMGETAITGAGSGQRAVSPGTASIGPMLSHGFDGAITMDSSRASDKRPAPLGQACVFGAGVLQSRKAGLARRRTKYSWKASSPSGVCTRVATGRR